MLLTASSVLIVAGLATSPTGAKGAEPVSTDEVRAIVSEMMADAETRSSLLAGAADAGHDGKFFLSSSDGAFRMNIGGQVQFRYVLNFRDDANSDDFDPGFETRRTKVKFDGTVHENWKFEILGAFERNGGGMILDTGWISYAWENGWTTGFGQFKGPFLREELVSSTSQLAADRGVVNEIFNQDRSQGIWGEYAEESWKVNLSVNDGFNTDNTGFTSSSEGDYGLTGRVEFLLEGDWKTFKDFTSPVGADFAAMLGGALHWQQGSTPSGSQTNAPGDTDNSLLTYTLDLSLEGDSWNAFGAFVGRHIESRTAGTDSEFDDFGVVVQGGYRFTEDTEAFARWDAVFGDDDRGGEDNWHYITVGVNQYYAGHAAKATVDVQFALDESDDLASLGGFPNSGIGLRGDTEGNEVVIRFQLQLLF